jgi:dihydroxyacetone kinase DhaL subunit (EC 2.7.1.121)
MSGDAEAVVDAVQAVAERIEAERDHLTDLDSAIGDADHGGNMARGWAEAADSVAELDDPDAQTVVKTAGKTVLSEVGGAAGPLYGGSLVFASQELEAGSHRKPPSPSRKRISKRSQTAATPPSATRRWLTR